MRAVRFRKNLTSTPLERARQRLVASCWQLSTEIPRVAACVALADSQSMYARHAEPAGWLRGALGEAEERDRFCMLECARAGTMASGAICQRTSRTSGRGRTWRTGADRFESDLVEASFRESR